MYIFQIWIIIYDGLFCFIQIQNQHTLSLYRWSWVNCPGDITVLISFCFVTPVRILFLCQRQTLFDGIKFQFIEWSVRCESKHAKMFWDLPVLGILDGGSVFQKRPSDWISNFIYPAISNMVDMSHTICAFDCLSQSGRRFFKWWMCGMRQGLVQPSREMRGRLIVVEDALLRCIFRAWWYYLW